MTARRELDNIIHPLCDDDEGTWRWERLLLIRSHVVNPMSRDGQKNVRNIKNCF